MTFTQAIDKILDGKRVTREEWGDKRHYGCLHDQLLHIHKAGEKEETLHPWLINEGDLLGEDWLVI